MSENKLNARCLNEWGKLDSVAVCRPASYAPTSQLECEFLLFLQPVSVQALQEDHGRLVEKLKEFGVTVYDLADHFNGEEAVSDLLPNRIYVRDVAGAAGDSLVFGRAASVCRYPEFSLSQAALRRLVGNIEDFSHTKKTPCDLESLEFGDFLILNDSTFLINYGNRTQSSEFAGLIDNLFKLGFTEGAAVSIPKETGIIHLDLACNVIGKNLAVAMEPFRFLPVQVYTADKAPHYEDVPSFFRRHGYDLRYFKVQEGVDFLTNYIHVDESSLLINTQYEQRFRELTDGSGIEFHTVDVTNLEKGGGSVRCCTLPLIRK